MVDFIKQLDSSANSFVIDSSGQVSDPLGVAASVLLERGNRLNQHNVENNGIILLRLLRQCFTRQLRLSEDDHQFMLQAKAHLLAIPHHQALLEFSKSAAHASVFAYHATLAGVRTDSGILSQPL